MKHYPKVLVAFLLLTLGALIFLYIIKKPFDSGKYSINFILGEKLVSNSLNDDFIRILNMSNDSLRKQTFIPVKFNVKYFYKEKDSTATFSQDFQTIDKVPARLVFTKTEKKLNENLKNIKLDPTFLKNSNLSLSSFIAQVNVTTNGKNLLVFSEDTTVKFLTLGGEKQITVLHNIDTLIKKRDELLSTISKSLIESIQCTIIYNPPADLVIPPLQGDFNSELSNLIKYNNTDEGKVILHKMLHDFFDNESRLYKIDTNDKEGKMRFNPSSAEEFLWDIYLTNDLMNIVTSNEKRNPSNGKIKSFNYYLIRP